MSQIYETVRINPSQQLYVAKRFRQYKESRFVVNWLNSRIFRFLYRVSRHFTGSQGILPSLSHSEWAKGYFSNVQRQRLEHRWKNYISTKNSMSLKSDGKKYPTVRSDINFRQTRMTERHPSTTVTAPYNSTTAPVPAATR